MTDRRKYELENGLGSPLTRSEGLMGYHFCPEGDGRIVGPLDDEMENCQCYNEQQEKNP